MVQPINYGVEIQDPTQSFLQAFKAGAAITDVRMAQEQAAIKAQQQKQIQDAFAKLRQPGATAQDYANLSMLLPETQAKAVRESFSMLNTEQQNAARSQAARVFSAFRAGKPDIAIGLIENQIQAKRNSGDEAGARFLETWRDVAKENPNATEDYFGGILAEMPGGKEVLAGALQISEERRKAALQSPALRKATAEATQAELATANTPTRLALENTQTAANIRNLDSQIADRAGRLVLDQNRLRLDRDKLQSDVEARLYELNQKGTQLDASATKLVNDAAVAAVGSEQAAGRMLDLAARLEQQGGGYGAFSGVNTWLRNATGNQDAWTQVRNEYVRLRNTQAVKSLPPGPATDRDIELALKPFPSENADAATIASFLRGMAKLQQYEAVAESAKSEWVNSVGSLGRATKDIQIGGVQVPKGTTYVDFARQFMDQRAQDLAATQAGRAVAGRGYMRWANPQTGAVPGAATPAAPEPATQSGGGRSVSGVVTRPDGTPVVPMAPGAAVPEGVNRQAWESMFPVAPQPGR
jgi:hypothetical protein